MVMYNGRSISYTTPVAVLKHSVLGLKSSVTFLGVGLALYIEPKKFIV